MLPAGLRKTLGLKTGESLLLAVEENGAMRLSTRRQRLEAARGLFATISPGRALSDELIQERREEVRLEKAAEALRVKKVLGLRKYFGSGIWQDDLSVMREDRKRARKRTTK